MGKRTGDQRPVADRQASGGEKVRKRKLREENEAKLAGSLNKYFMNSDLGHSRLKPNDKDSAFEDAESTFMNVDVQTGESHLSLFSEISYEISNHTGSSSHGPGNSGENSDSFLLSDPCEAEVPSRLGRQPQQNKCNAEDEEAPNPLISCSPTLVDEIATESETIPLFQEPENLIFKTNEDPALAEGAIFKSVDFSDPSLWPYPLQNNLRSQLISNGPMQKKLQIYPVTNGRSFHNSHYLRNTLTKEIQLREWLLYSESSDSLFCFPCCIFLPTENCPWSSFGNFRRGFSAFVYQSKAIKEHESTATHFRAVIHWKDFIKRSENERLLDKSLQANFERETSLWRRILRSMIEAALFLAKNNLAFRGSCETLGAPNCGNFLSLIELLSHYHPPLALHIERLRKGKVSYLSPQIQNEFISLAARAVRSSIIDKIKARKFFAILFDATPDCSHKEQISQVIRTVNVKKDGCNIEENFVDFVHFDKKKGSELSEAILLKLAMDGLDILNCRGQGYDNGANMAGVYNGVQAHIKRVNELAEFIPCAAHTLNLVGQNAATKVLTGKLILGQIQTLYTFFASSPSRWNVLKPHVGKVLKSQSQTRWSSKAVAVNVLFDEYEGVLESLVELIHADGTNSTTLVEANANFNQINNFRFILGLTIWNTILSRINTTSVILQKESIDIDHASRHLESLLNWLVEFFKTGFQECLLKAKAKASSIGIAEDTGFQYRITRNQLPQRFRQQYGVHDVATMKSNIDKFKDEFFDLVMKNVLSDIRIRFKYIKQTSEDFNFLWGKVLSCSSTQDLRNASQSLASKYHNDLDAGMFSSEVSSLRDAVTPFLESKELSETTALDIINVLTSHELHGDYFNCHTALRIFLTMPVTVAGNERSFSKLKLIKNYLRSTMGQERLSDLAILSIESKESSIVCFDSIIDEFAATKCRKVPI